MANKWIENCLKTVQKLFGKGLKTVWKLFENCLETVQNGKLLEPSNSVPVLFRRLCKEVYTREGKIVFTEAFHLKRGYCCGNQCLHCPYDPKGKRGNTVIKEGLSDSIEFRILNREDLW